MDGDDSSNCSSSLLSAAAAAAANNNAYDVSATKKIKASPATATNDDDGSKNLKRKERLEQNRLSARESRKRKKNMIEELQRTVITLSREHKELTQRNETLKQQMADLNEKVREIRNQCS
jgi:chromosome segregation ATPase